MPQLDLAWFPGQMFWFALTFAAMFLAVRFMIVPRLASVMAERERIVGEDLSTARRLKEEAEVAHKAYEASLAAARAEAAELMASASRDMETAARKRQAAQAARMEEVVAAAQAELAGQEAAMRRSMRADVVRLTTAAVRRLSRDPVDAGRISQAVDEAFAAGGSHA
ncbi:hypothetical protein FACS1894186_4060 [Alphaproteobacteria bacterium]|nr:hypothetical protein FACS1894186_4060 [Alphaproteobacteria bacterium]